MVADCAVLRCKLDQEADLITHRIGPRPRLPNLSW
jgi:hypothetical protein